MLSRIGGSPAGTCRRAHRPHSLAVDPGELERRRPSSDSRVGAQGTTVRDSTPHGQTGRSRTGGAPAVPPPGPRCGAVSGGLARGLVGGR